MILDPANFPAWLGEAPAAPEQLQTLLRPYPPERMEAHTIGPEIGNVRNDNAGTREEVAKLITEVMTPPGLPLSALTLTDHRGLVWALFYLFPPSARAAVIGPYSEGKTNASDLAKLAEIPALFVPWIMSEHYMTWYKKLMGIA